MFAARRAFARSALLVNQRAIAGARAVHVEANKASVQAAIANERVLVFAKTYCPHCARVKALLNDLKTDFEVVELDERADGAEIQAILLELTKQRTVPNVFIKGQHIGGADATVALHADKKLVPLLQ
uniref:Glutaredoxin domain-containing protein n=1 Tax=Globisporangium ultimum (strain ATCC 200006 / CBS 805.95 / DAOM BR144) TaxID=431595 RepID=K3WHD5_GLOUD